MRLRCALATLAFVAGCGDDDEPDRATDRPSLTVDSSTLQSRRERFEATQIRVQEGMVQSQLRLALIAAKVLAVDAGGGTFYFDGREMGPEDLAAAEPSLTFGDVASTATVGVEVEAGGFSITLEKLTKSGTSFGITANAAGRVAYCRGDAAGDCDDATTDEFVVDPW